MKRMQEDALGRALHEEGQRMGPAFSRLLHERVMGALAECGMEVSPERRRGNWRLKVMWPLGVAAALAIAAGTWAWLQPRPGMGHDNGAIVSARPGPLEMPDFNQVQQEIVPVEAAAPEEDEALDQARYASLNRDAQKLASFIADQVPSFTQ